MTVLDLDAARAARAEKRTADDGHAIRLGGADMPLPDELPFAFGLALGEGRPHDALKALLGQDGYRRAIEECDLTSDDWAEILAEVPQMYGFASAPESLASSDDSPDGGTPPRQTSPASTD